MKSIIYKYNKTNNIFAIFVGYTGTIPFIFLALCVWILDHEYILKISNAIIIYSYIILTFIGAVYWGLGVSIDNSKRSFKYYIYSVTPSLVCWFLFLLNLANLVNIIFIIIFINLSLLLEKKLLNKRKLNWYLLLRLRLNIIVTFSLLAFLTRLILFNFFN